MSGQAPDLTARTLQQVRDQPGRTAYALARELGIRYRPGGRVKCDTVLAALEGLQARGLVCERDDGPRVAWYPEYEPAPMNRLRGAPGAGNDRG